MIFERSGAALLLIMKTVRPRQIRIVVSGLRRLNQRRTAPYLTGWDTLSGCGPASC
jgi:hypothetical protein